MEITIKGDDKGKVEDMARDIQAIGYPRMQESYWCEKKDEHVIQLKEEKK